MVLINSSDSFHAENSPDYIITQHVCLTIIARNPYCRYLGGIYCRYPLETPFNSEDNTWTIPIPIPINRY